MKMTRKYYLLFIVTALIIVLVVLRLFSTNRFTEPGSVLTFTGNGRPAFMTAESAMSVKGRILLIDIDSSGYSLPDMEADILNIGISSLTSRGTMKLIYSCDCPILIYSADPALSSRLWMILREMGKEYLYILSESRDNEVFKYEFRPDTITGPES